MIDTFPWYTIVKKEENISQGDFLIIPSGEHANEEIEVIILSQSCDLVEREGGPKIEKVLTAPIWDLRRISKQSNFYSSVMGRDALRKGQVISYHLLDICDLKPYKKYYSVVDFAEIATLPYDEVREIKNEQENDYRLRLLPPYREHLSQAIARFFMRVGLPTDIFDFTLWYEITEDALSVISGNDKVRLQKRQKISATKLIEQLYEAGFTKKEIQEIFDASIIIPNPKKK